jgi:hypothetical protein
MTNPLNSVLVQNIETFEHIICLNIDGLSPENALSAWLETRDYGIVSFDEDPDGEFGYIALVASTDGPDFMLDEVTGEMEPIEEINAAVALQMKMDIMMEINAADDDLIPVLVDDINLAPVPTEANPIVNPVAFTPLMSTSTCGGEPIPLLDSGFKPSLAGALLTSARSITAANKAKNSTKGNKMKAHQYLSQLIIANPGISRSVVFTDIALRTRFLKLPIITLIDAGDKQETKRWNRRLNRFIRQIRRDGEDIRIERTKNVASYTIGAPSGQLEMPFTEQAVARNEAITGNDVNNEVLDAPKSIDFHRISEDADQSLSFDDLLNTLDDEYVAPSAK